MAQSEESSSQLYLIHVLESQGGISSTPPFANPVTMVFKLLTKLHHLAFRRINLARASFLMHFYFSNLKKISFRGFHLHEALSWIK